MSDELRNFYKQFPQYGVAQDVRREDLRPYDPMAVVLGECCGHEVAHHVRQSDAGVQYIGCATCGPCMSVPPAGVA